MRNGFLLLALAVGGFVAGGQSRVEGAQARTKNFIVDIAGATPETAGRIGEWAEHYRKKKAIEWLGQEMPAWGVPCPLKVTLTHDASSGATSFTFEKGSILAIDMKIAGSMDRLLASVLPHEVTHTVFAYRFRVPVPRWADEGAAILSEDKEECRRHDLLARRILKAPGRAIPLRRLLQLKDYPRDVIVLYAEGYSVTRFLVEVKSRKTFLAFVQAGMKSGWDKAVRDHYGYADVDEMEEAWLKSLRDSGGRAGEEKKDSAPKEARGGKEQTEDRKGEAKVGLRGPAWVVVTVPGDARLTVDGEPTRSTSTVRTFETPRLVPGKVYAYDFEARFTRDGTPVTVSRRIKIKAGKTVRSDMSRESVSVAGK